jgi:hypothetical protein
MLAADLSGRPYVKSSHSRALMAQIGRTRRSVEFKHQNISAVLDELGMPWIPGYKPKGNYQNAIFDAIDRYLTKHPDILEPVPASPAAMRLSPQNLCRAANASSDRRADPRAPTAPCPEIRPGGTGPSQPFSWQGRGRVCCRSGTPATDWSRPLGPSAKGPMGCRRRWRWGRLRCSVVRTNRARAIAGGENHQWICADAILPDPQRARLGNGAPCGLEHLPRSPVLYGTPHFYDTAASGARGES